MVERDFYEVLGVPRNADAEAIRAAYRTLARRYHPDVNKDEGAQAKFTEVQEAYDVLSDPEKRGLYDRVGRSGYRAAAGAGGGATYSWSNVAGQGGNVDFDADDLQSMFDVFFGGRGASERSPFGRGARRAQRSGSPARGRDRSAEITIPFDVAIKGGKRSIRTGGAQGREIDVAIPAGIGQGAKLRVRGEGEPSHAGPGDLILTVRFAKHPVWERGRPDGRGRDGSGPEGLDITLELPLTVGEAILGTGVEVPTPSGTVTLAVPPGTGSHARLRLRGRGVAANGQTGDLYAVVKIVVPDALTDEQRAAVEVLANSVASPRTGNLWPA
ncbi:MAG: DnaJ C-terminal domain-containing protein [Planctomycetota bacterium]